MTVHACPKPSNRRMHQQAIIYPNGEGNREVCAGNAAGKRIYKARTLEMAERQNWLCALCGKTMHGWTPSFDHEIPKSGGRRDDRCILPDGSILNRAAHWHCNGERGSKPAKYVL